MKAIVINLLWFGFVFGAVNGCFSLYDSYMEAKGKAVSHFIAKVYDLKVPPEEAQYFDVVLTGVDVKFESVDIFPSLLKGAK